MKKWGKANEEMSDQVVKTYPDVRTITGEYLVERSRSNSGSTELVNLETRRRILRRRVTPPDFNKRLFCRCQSRSFSYRALVVLFLTFREADLQLHTPFAPVQIERNERVAFSFDSTNQPIDLCAVEQKLTCPCRVCADVRRCAQQWREVGTEQPGLVILELYVGFRDLAAPGPEAFDLPTFELKARFKRSLR